MTSVTRRERRMPNDEESSSSDQQITHTNAENIESTIPHWEPKFGAISDLQWRPDQANLKRTYIRN